MGNAARASGLAGAVLGVWLALPTTAHGHPRVDEGRRRFESADFQGALAALREAEESNDLVLADLLQLLETRLLVQQALGDDRGMEQTLLALASVGPEHGFGPEVSPDLQARYRQVRTGLAASLAVEAQVSREDDAVLITAAASHDPAELVRRLDVVARADEGAWERHTTTARFDASDVRRIDYYALALGPGGAVIAQHGGEQSPLQFELGSDRRGGADGPSGPADESEVPWLWVGVGGGVAVAAILFTLLAVSGGEDERLTQPSAPMIEFP